MTFATHRKNVLALLLASAALSPGTSAANETAQTIGEAYDLKSDKLLYRETHCVDGDSSKREVIYQSGDGALIARKALDYSSGPTTPSFVQDNLYSREKIEVSLKQGKVTMAVFDEGNPEPKKSTSTEPDGRVPVVIDAGFDEFVRENWDSLVAGETRSFMFPFAARSSLMELRIRSSACSYETTTDQCFRLELSNWFFRMVADPIELGYDSGPRRLTRYRGLSNIGDENGNGLVVDIRYGYQDIPELACRVKQQALTEGLDKPDSVLLSGVGGSR
ncbi:MAG: hypothetical protein OEN02_15370 [Gammaproteobacteria bacterium]|nr:hypothetical protein [Gammaproteobacteria bacterium]MDH3534356.1 hypothetical protein [Gammaproteobacteria bacterium]